MLAGLLFATHEAEDRPGALAATLPFAAGTLIEYQARLLAACGATQIVVVVARLTPELIGAMARIGRRGMAVDAVRSAGDAAAKLHPLARIVMLADGLVTTEAVVGAVAGEGGDTLLVVPADRAQPSFERVGGNQAWAGVARIDARRVAEAAGMPADYDLQSTLLHAAAQAGARALVLPLGELALGHGIERRAGALAERGRAVLSASVALRPGWFNRFVLRPIARLGVPALAARGAPTAATGAAGAAVALGGLATIVLGQVALGLAIVLAGVILIELAAALAMFRDEDRLLRLCHGAVLTLPALAALATAHVTDAAAGTSTARLLAVAGLVAAVIAERAAGRAARRGWWGDPLAYLLVLVLFALAGMPVLALAIGAIYAATTLAAAVEALRRHA